MLAWKPPPPSQPLASNTSNAAPGHVTEPHAEQPEQDRLSMYAANPEAGVAVQPAGHAPPPFFSTQSAPSVATATGTHACVPVHPNAAPRCRSAGQMSSAAEKGGEAS